MSQRPYRHHTCVACASRLLFSFTNCPRKGLFYTVDEYGQQVYLFNLFYDQAVVQARRGCEFMKWLISMGGGYTGTQLRVALSMVGVFELHFEWVTDPQESVLGAVERFTLCANESDPAALEVFARPPNQDPSSQETMSKCREWLAHCLTNHQACSKPFPSTSNPRRLIEVSGSTSSPFLKLVINSNGSMFQYAALSYCWGGDQNIVLLQQNLKSWLSEIPYSSLPQTIKDALKITSELSLKHLWVDALCIIQDDSQDKLHQISQMADVYEQASVTISASRATSVKDGFLQIRRIHGEQGFSLPFMCKNGKLGSVILWRKRSVGWNEPIDQRGWTLQESLISVRTLEYGKNQLRWRCHSSTETDGWTPGKIDNFQVNIDWDMVAGRTTRTNIFGSGFVSMWKRIVQNYSRRTLGNADDKLLALSSIARKFGQLTGNEYMAGLWKHALCELLLWRPIETGKYTLRYVAPSWSWASIDAHWIRFEATSGVHMEVLDISIVTLDPCDVYTSVTAGSLQLRAKALEVIIRPHAEEPQILKFQKLTFWHPKSTDVSLGQGYCDVSADDLDKNIWNNTVLLLQATSNHGLILRELEDGSFLRIGIFDSYDRSKHSSPSQYDHNIMWRHPDWVERSVIIR